MPFMTDTTGPNTAATEGWDGHSVTAVSFVGKAPVRERHEHDKTAVQTKLTRSSAMAIGIGIGFLLVVEGLITIVAPDAGPYLPGGTLSTLAAGGNDQLAWGAALGLVVLYGVVAATVSLAVFRTRDIVS
jgi:hypothetical protein